MEQGQDRDFGKAKTVTLFDNGHTYQLGDVDHDGNVTITDVTVLIDCLLGSQEGACLICADVDLDGKVTITDVTELIDMLLGGN